MLLESVFHAVENGSAECVVRIDDADFLVTERLPHAVNLFLGFIGVACTDGDDPLAKRRVERLGAREETDKGNFVGFGERDVFDGSWCADEKAHGKNAEGLQMFEAVSGFCGIVAVIGSDQFQFAAMNAALFVDGVEVSPGASHSLRSKKSGWAF